MLLERCGCFGGNITQAGVESIAWYRHAETVDVQDIGIEFEQRAKQMGATDHEPQSQSEALNTKLFKVVADTLVQEAGIGIFPEFLDAYGIVILPTTGRYFQVPFGIMVPKKVENLLVAGRCLAGDRISHSATRQMMCCTVTGQGAGVAAALSIKDGVSCSQIDITRLQRALMKQGVRIR